MSEATWIDVPGDIAHDEPIDFSIAVAPVCVTLEFLTGTVPNQGDWAVVYDDGRFSWRFRDSGIDPLDATHWTIRPPGGSWNGIPFRVHVNPTFRGIGGGGIAPNLSPILSPDAWYVLDPISRLVDQSGNGNHVVENDAFDNVAGPLVGYVAGKAGKLRRAEAAAFRTGGAQSFVALVHRNNVATSATWLCGVENSGASWGTWWKWGVTADGRLAWACDRGGAAPLQIFANLSAVDSVPPNGWCVVAGTHSANGLVSKGYVDGALTGTYEQDSAGFGSATAWLFAGQDGFLTPTDVRIMAVGIYLRELSAAEVGDVSLALRGVAS